MPNSQLATLDRPSKPAGAAPGGHERVLDDLLGEALVTNLGAGVGVQRATESRIQRVDGGRVSASELSDELGFAAFSVVHCAPAQRRDQSHSPRNLPLGRRKGRLADAPQTRASYGE